MQFARLIARVTVATTLLAGGAAAMTPAGSEADKASPPAPAATAPADPSPISSPTPAANEQMPSTEPPVTASSTPSPASNAPSSSPAEPATTPSATSVAPAIVTPAPASATPADASQPAPVTPPVVAVPAPAPEPVVATPAELSPDAVLADRLRSVLTDIPATLKGRDRAERQALVTFYEGRSWQPVWVSASGWLTPKGETLLTEVKDADAWGLKAADFDTASLASADRPASPDVASRAGAEVQLASVALKYARHARGGRAEPLTLSQNLDRKLSLIEPAVVLDGLATGDDPAAYLRGLHPQHPQFEALRKAYVEALSAAKETAALPKVPDGPRIAVGARHADIAIIRQRLGVPAKADGPEDAETLLDADLVKAVAEFQTSHGIKPANGIVTPATRRAFNAALEYSNARRLLVNMEQWRWMPEDLGSMYIWVSIPDFTFNVVKDGVIIHSERIVVGKPATQTPIFSDQMATVVFHPEWGVPDSIKVKELLPSLRAGTGILTKQNMRVVYSGKVVDASSVDWATVDVRRFSFIQGSGPGNALGAVKFLFPNHHDVYMHDTPTKGLFSQPVRAFSHGCIRVQNPVRLAELLLSEDKGMASDRVRSLMTANAPKNNSVTLSRKIPVHLTYFTASVDKDGKVNYRRDLYGHEQRIAMGIEGKAHLIVHPKPDAVPTPAPVGSLKEIVKSRPSDRSWMRDVFNN